MFTSCLLYTSDAADETVRVYLGGRRIIKAPVDKANLLGDIFFDTHLPIRTPTMLELINARELPRKTIIGLPDSAESINVAI